MGILLIYLLLRIGFAFGSNYGYVEWSDNDKDSETRTRYPVYSTPNNRDPQYHPTLFNKPVTERTVVAHKIEEDLPRVVTAFLHTGDSATLEHVNCSRRYELSSLRGGSQVASHYSLHSVLDTMAHATNFLNMLLQSNRSREQSIRRDIQWYHALVRSMLEGDPKIHRAVVTFHAESPTPGPQVFLQATRKNKDIVLQDLSSSAAHRLRNRAPDSEWYHDFRDRKKPHVSRVVSSRDGRTAQDGYVLDKDQIKWSAPYLECENGNFVPFWLLTLSAGFYGLRANSAPEFRGVVRVDVNLQDVDIDQCSSSGWFAGTHRCNLTSMECKPIMGHGFVLDKYKCQCKRGFYHPSRVALNGFSSKERGSHRDESEVSGKCLPCQEGCPFCRDDSPCLAQEDGSLRLAIASFQGLSMLLDFIGMVVVYHFRRNKRIRASGLILLEAILCGALLLYFPVMIMYFHPSVFRCILLRWVRLLGFATVYGTVTLKLYRVLKVFLSRTAQRIPYITSCRVLRLLGVILLVVCWFLVAWTSTVTQHPDWHRALVDVGATPEGLQFSMCLLDRWDYMMAVAEFLFLLWGVYLCYAVRTVPSAFHEPRYMAVAVYNELLISAIFHIIRFSLASDLHPDWMLTLFFVHTHLTVTVTLGLMFIPKFFSSETHTRDDIATEAYEDELDMGRSGSYLNSSITSAWSEHSLDPEDIREELKKLYTQLEIYKSKKMLANNPHLQKKRSSKKGLGRSLMRRITEIPETMSRQCSREDRDGSEHGSNRSTLRRNHLDARSREDSLKNKMFSVKRSHSYDHVCDQNGDPSASTTPEKLEGSTTEGSLLDTLMGRKAKKASEPPKVEPAESAESVPLVCKSVSAHNLTADKKPIHLRTSIMQKSLSVIASARERTLGLTGKTHSVEDASKKGQKARDGRLSEVDESPECYPKMIISQSVEYSKTPSKMGIMKQQVSGSQPSICSEHGRSKELYDLSEVCPWEVEDLPTPSEGKAQKHVSIASCEATAVHGGGSKSSRSQQRQKGTGQSPSNRRRSRDKGGDRDEMPRKPRSPLNLAPNHEACPWDADEPRESAGLSPDRTGRKKSVTPTDGKPKVLHSDHSKSTGSLLQPPTLMVEICPWDYDAPPSPKQDRAVSPTYHAKPKDSHSKRKGSCSSKSKDKDDERRQSKGRERRSSSSKGSERRRVSQSSDSGQAAMTSSGRRRSSTREAGLTESKRAEACPWGAGTVPDGITRDGTSTSPSPSTARDKPSHPKPAGPLKSVNMEDVCPWDF
ncbi:probable G-protein coupled receptor 158 [Alosa sapidissima]|uniref:probable G-protein coupled receptor 158 n=1 Tax=Alosa sapidissima TaxID=34773 RepID=UPI001C0A0218|nr:probable G-protein coupled receptor 158 [Alosa sapidissima]XP_041966372.1 probable G-protein coupled receptor 158 [Alosa sapidissima]